MIFLKNYLEKTKQPYSGRSNINYEENYYEDIVSSDNNNYFVNKENNSNNNNCNSTLAKGIFTNKKNFSSLILAHGQNSGNPNKINNTNYEPGNHVSQTDIKNAPTFNKINNKKNEFTSSSSYGAHYRVMK